MRRTGSWRSAAVTKIDPPAGSRQVVEPPPVAGHLLVLAVPHALVLDREALLGPGEVDSRDGSVADPDAVLGDRIGQVGAVDQQPQPRLLRRSGEPVGELGDPADVAAVAPGQAVGGRPHLAEEDQPRHEEPVEGDDGLVQRPDSCEIQRCSHRGGGRDTAACGDLGRREGPPRQQDAGDGAGGGPRGHGALHCILRAGQLHAPQDSGAPARRNGSRNEQAGDGVRAQFVRHRQRGAGVDVRVEPPPRRTSQLVGGHAARADSGRPAKYPADEVRRARWEASAPRNVPDAGACRPRPQVGRRDAAYGGVPGG